MSVDSIVGIKISELNSNIDLKVEKLVDENKSIETITLSKTSMKYKWVVLLIILFIVLILKYNYCS